MNTLYADIIVDISHEKLDRTFQYRVPESLRGRLEPGACVMIPFGNGNRLIKGYVVALGETCQFAPEKIKDIAGMPEKETGVEDKMIALAAWIRRNYGCTMIQALKTVLPAKQSVKKLEHRQLVRLMNREEILSLLGECERKKQVAKARLLKALSEQETIPYEWITGKLGVSAATVNSIVKSGAAKLVSSESYRNPVKMQSVETVHNTLSEEQQTIVTEVLADFDAGRRQTYLIHGITGSGKTEVYMRLIGEMIARGRQAIVLIPEIALTYQTLLRFYQRFGDRVSVMNSTLSPGEKYDQCERAKAGEIDVIIGPRSALFTPFPSLGLIVMDEDDCMVDIAKFFLEFTVEESCGKCTACRIGTKRMLEILTKITKGQADMAVLDKPEKLCYYVKNNSLCGLGQTAPNPVLSTLRYFRDEYEAHIKEKRCPAGVCKALLSYNIDRDKCRGCTLCARTCPAGAIIGSVKNPHIIDQNKCIKCGACMEKCKFGAIYKK